MKNSETYEIITWQLEIFFNDQIFIPNISQYRTLKTGEQGLRLDYEVGKIWLK